MIQELAVMLAIALGGVAISLLFEVKNRWLMLPFGLASVICLRMVTYSVTVPFAVEGYSIILFYIALAAIVLVATFKFKRRLFDSVAISVSAAVSAWLLGRVLALKPQGHSDSTWILVMSNLFEQGTTPSLLYGKVPFKRGFDYPLMLSLGPAEEYLSALTPYIFLAIIAGMVWAISALNLPKRITVIFGIAIAAVSLTATVTLRMVTYINGHTLTALGVLLIAVTVVLAVRKQELNRTDLAVLMVSIATVSTTRPEGILVCVMALLPLLASRFVTRIQLMLLASSATVSLAVWLNVYDSYIIKALGIGHLAFDLILIGAGLLPWLKWFDWLRYRLVPIALVSMTLLVVAAQVIFFRGMQQGNQALFVNLVLGAGQWGYLFPFLVVIFVLVGFRGLSAEYRNLAVITVTLILSFLIAKMLDGGQSGRPDLGRIGWTDSLNRMWIHLVPLLLVTALVGLVERYSALAAKVKN